jgi:hypothetical protein
MQTTQTTQITTIRYVCRHIHTAGHRCGSPALRNEDFCYFHHTTRRPAPSPKFIPPDAAFDLPSFEDRASIQLAITEIARRVAMNQLDRRRAGILLYAIQIASSNLQRGTKTTPETDHEDLDQIDEFDLDPIQGPLAPIAEVPTRNAAPKGLLGHILESIRRQQAHCPTCNPNGKIPTQQPEPEQYDDEGMELYPNRHRPSPPNNDPDPNPDPNPTTLPTIQAVATTKRRGLRNSLDPISCSDTRVRPQTSIPTPHPAPKARHILAWGEAPGAKTTSSKGLKARHNRPKCERVTQASSGTEFSALRESRSRRLTSNVAGLVAVDRIELSTYGL